MAGPTRSSRSLSGILAVTSASTIAGNLTNLTDSAGNQISFFVNDLGQRVAIADPDIGFWQYTLDVAGRLKNPDRRQRINNLNSSTMMLLVA